MQNMGVENQLLDPHPNGSAPEQEKEPVQSISASPCSMDIEVEEFEQATNVHSKISKKKLSTCYKDKKAIIGIVFPALIFSFAFSLGTLVPLNCQKEAIKCPPDWIAHQGHCYKFSREEKNWNESQNVCILHKASLAKITEEEMDFVMKLTRNHVFWIGLNKEQDQPWKWPDGENATLEVLGNGGDCALLNDDGTASSGRCRTEHRYICKKN